MPDRKQTEPRYISPGSPPFGYKRGKEGLILDRTRVPVVRAFFEHFLLYGSLRAAVRHLAQRFQKVIAVSTGRQWLTNPIYRGDLSCGGEPPKILRDSHAAILSREESAQIDRLLRRNRTVAPRSASAERSLAGLVICQECHKKMTIVSVKPRQQSKEKNRSYLYLRCLECPQSKRCKGLQYTIILENVIQQICTVLPQSLSGRGNDSLSMVKVNIEQEIHRLQGILSQIPQLLAQDIFDRQSADIRSFHLQIEIAALEQQLSQLPPLNLATIVQSICIPQFWQDLSETERRRYFREFIRSIQVTPESTIEIQFIF